MKNLLGKFALLAGAGTIAKKVIKKYKKTKKDRIKDEIIETFNDAYKYIDKHIDIKKVSKEIKETKNNLFDELKEIIKNAENAVKNELKENKILRDELREEISYENNRSGLRGRSLRDKAWGVKNNRFNGKIKREGADNIANAFHGENFRKNNIEGGLNSGRNIIDRLKRKMEGNPFERNRQNGMNTRSGNPFERNRQNGMNARNGNPFERNKQNKINREGNPFRNFRDNSGTYTVRSSDSNSSRKNSIKNNIKNKLISFIEKI